MYTIEVTDDKEIIKNCPKSAKAGDIVAIKTNTFMDAIPKINVNGSDIGEWCYRQDVMSAKRRHIMSERRDKMVEETV